MNVALSKRPLDKWPDRLGHVPFAPTTLRQDIAEIDPVAMEFGLDHSDWAIRAFDGKCPEPWSDVLFRGKSVAQVRDHSFDRPMRSPAQESGHLGVLGVLDEDRFGICNGRPTQN
jgi:hypothetical protein